MAASIGENVSWLTMARMQRKRGTILEVKVFTGDTHPGCFCPNCGGRKLYKIKEQMVHPITGWQAVRLAIECANCQIDLADDLRISIPDQERN